MLDFSIEWFRVSAGESLLIPSRCWHWGMNLGTNQALSVNYLPPTLAGVLDTVRLMQADVLDAYLDVLDIFVDGYNKDAIYAKLRFTINTWPIFDLMLSDSDSHSANPLARLHCIKRHPLYAMMGHMYTLVKENDGEKDTSEHTHIPTLFGHQGRCAPTTWRKQSGFNQKQRERFHAHFTITERQLTDALLPWKAKP